MLKRNIKILHSGAVFTGTEQGILAGRLANYLRTQRRILRVWHFHHQLVNLTILQQMRALQLQAATRKFNHFCRHNITRLDEDGSAPGNNQLLINTNLTYGKEMQQLKINLQ